MTNAIAVPGQVNPNALALAQSLSAEQLQMLVQVLAPQVRASDLLESTLESLADRLAGNGLTSDMAGHWAGLVRDAHAADLRPAAADLVDELVSHLSATGVDRSQGQALSRSIVATLGELRAPDPTIIDTTARQVDGGERQPGTVAGWTTARQAEAGPRPDVYTTESRREADPPDAAPHVYPEPDYQKAEPPPRSSGA